MKRLMHNLDDLAGLDIVIARSREAEAFRPDPSRAPPTARDGFLARLAREPLAQLKARAAGLWSRAA